MNSAPGPITTVDHLLEVVWFGGLTVHGGRPVLPRGRDRVDDLVRRAAVGDALVSSSEWQASVRSYEAAHPTRRGVEVGDVLRWMHEYTVDLLAEVAELRRRSGSDG